MINNVAEVMIRKWLVTAKFETHNVIEVLENNWDRFPINLNNDFEAKPFRPNCPYKS